MDRAASSAATTLTARMRADMLHTLSPESGLQSRAETRVNAPSPGDVSNSSELQIPWAQWPNGSKNEQGGPVNAAQADDGNNNFFSSIGDGSGNNAIHSQSYSDSDMQGGYMQGANIAFDSTGDVGIAFWLGSYYGNDGEAAAVVNDVNSTLNSNNAQVQGCASGSPSDCSLSVFTWTDSQGNDHMTGYFFWSEANVVGEAAVDGYVQSINANQDTSAKDTAQLAVAGMQTVHAAVTGTSSSTGQPSNQPLQISVDQVAILHKVNGQVTTTRTPKVGERVMFIATYHLNNPGKYVRWGTVVFTKNGSPIFSMKLQSITLNDGSHALAQFTQFQRPSLAGYIVAHFSLYVGPATATPTLGFWLQNSSSGSTSASSTSTGSSTQPASNSAPQITVDQVQVLHRVNGQLAATRTPAVGERVTFLATYHTTAPGKYVRWGTVQFTKNGTPLFSMKLNSLTLSNGTWGLANSTQFLRPSLAGYIVARFTVHVGPAAATPTLGFWLQKTGAGVSGSNGASARSPAPLATLMLHLSDLRAGYVGSSGYANQPSFTNDRGQLLTHGYVTTYGGEFQTTQRQGSHVQTLILEEGSQFKSANGAHWALLQATRFWTHPIPIAPLGDESRAYIVPYEDNYWQGVEVTFRRGNYVVTITLYRTPLDPQAVRALAQLVDQRILQHG